MPSPVSHFFDLQGATQTPIRLHCLEWGDPASSKIVLCAHGLSRNAHDFDYLAEALAEKGFRVLCPEMPGRGQSPWLADATQYQYATYAILLQQLIAHLGIHSLHWVGTSMGGILGMMLANTPNQLIASLVLNDIGPLVSAAGLKNIALYSAGATQFATLTEAEQALRAKMASFGIRNEAHWRHVLTYGIEPCEKGFRFAYDPAIMSAFPTGPELTDIDLWGFWEGVATIPVCVIRGADSDLLSREMLAMMKAKHSQLVAHEIPATGHAPMLMEPEQIQMVVGFITKH